MKKQGLAVFFSLSTMLISAQSWVIVSNNQLPANFEFESISVVNDNVVWAVADTVSFAATIFPTQVPLVMRTIDGGATWDIRVVSEAIGRYGFDIQGIDENIAIITTNKFTGGNNDNRPIFRTTDGGLNWAEIVPENSSGGLAIHFFDSQHGFVMNRDQVSVTEDGGQNWSLINAATIPDFLPNEYNLVYNLSNFETVFHHSAWIGTSRGRVFHTSNQGYNWDVTQAAETNELVVSMAFTDSLNGVLSTGQAPYKMYKTDDGGTTWSFLENAPMPYMTNLCTVPNAAGIYFGGSNYLSTEANFISLSSDNCYGKSWNTVLDSFVTNGIQFFDSNTGYAIGWSLKAADTVSIGGEIYTFNQILKWEGQVSEGEDVNQINADIKLSPNPAFDRISITIPTEIRFVSMSIVSSNGVKCFDFSSPTAEVDISKLPSGLYFVECIDVNGRVYVQKMLKL